MGEDLPPRGPLQNDEKGREKEAEKGRGVEEKYRRDPLGTIVWACILIAAGVILVLENAEALPQVGSLEAWNWISLAIGVILVGEVVVRMSVPDYARPLTGRLILAVLFLLGGLGGLLQVSGAVVGAVALILVGVLLLAGALFRRP